MNLSIIDKLLNLIFPRSHLETEIEKLDLESLIVKALPSFNKDEEGITSFLSYGDPLVRELIHLLKYKNSSKAENLCAELLVEKLREPLAEEMEWRGQHKRLLIPIPMSPARLRERGRNHMETLAKKIMKEGGEQLFELDLTTLIRIKETPTQTSIKNKADRQKNIKGVFAVSDLSKIKGTHVLLLDDVSTTGATLHEAKKTLLAGGARDVWCVTIAH